MTRFLFERQQQADGSMPRNSLPNGKPAPDSFNTQLDECAYPLVMALAVGLTDNAYYKAHIAPAANFVASHGPSSGPERWEEQSGFSPSTISAEIAGLVAAAIIADRNGDHASARVWRGVADEFQRNLKKWTLTTNGPLGPGATSSACPRTAIPTRRSPTTSATAARRSTSARSSTPASSSTRASALLSPTDADIIALAAGRRRDDQAQHGQRRRVPALQRRRLRRRRSPDGHPWAPGNKGNGHPWPVLAGERGQYEIDRGKHSAAIARLDSMRNMSSGVGLIAEQAWDHPDLAASPFGTDPTIASIGFRNGKPAGSASALTWSAGQFVRLTLDAAAGRCSTARPTRSTATSGTRRARPR